MQQITDTILMIRPVNFRMNEQTAVNNYYQQELEHMLPASINAKAQEEFDNFVGILEAEGVNVVVIEDTKVPITPDAVFPNNWISFHDRGDVVIYPMFAENRRLEKREDVLEVLEDIGFLINSVMDYSVAEEDAIFLEGTGSMILDRVNQKAYCALSPRANEDLFIEFCEDFEYTPVIFEANQTVKGERVAIYHTNVMMCVAETFAVVCLEAIDDKKERKEVVKHLKSDGKEIININEKQVAQFAGNILQLKGKNDQRLIVMSSSAYKALHSNQISTLQKHGKIVQSSLQTIETCGGGSARCMMAEVFLPK